MDSSPGLPNIDQIASTAGSVAELVDEKADDISESAATIARSTTDALENATDVAVDAIELAGPAIVGAAPTIGRFIWRHKTWVILGLLAATVVIVVRWKREEAGSESTAERAEERPPTVDGPTQAAS